MGLNKQELLGKKDLSDFEKRWLADRNVDHPALANVDDVPAPGDVGDGNLSDEPGEYETLQPYEDMDHADLKAEAGGRGLSKSGSKAELIARLEEHDAAQAETI